MGQSSRAADTLHAQDAAYRFDYKRLISIRCFCKA